MPGIGIISNPHAKVNRIDPEHNTLIWYVLGNSGQFEVTNSLSDLATVCENFCKQGLDHVGIIGGDGTVSRTLSALARAYGQDQLPKILILRGGTVNVLATNLGIYGKPKDILADFLDFLHSNNPLHQMSVRSLIVDDELGFLFGTGGAVRFLEAFYQNKTSALGAGKFFTRVLADGLLQGKLTGEYLRFSELENLNITSEFQGHSINFDTRSAIVLGSSLPKIPYGFNYFPDLAASNHYAEAIIAEWDQKQLVGEIIKSLIKKDKNKSHFNRIRFEKMKIRFSAPTKYTLDGEILDAKDQVMNVSLGPVFKFCSPYGKLLGS